jgi:hypothetical protein
MNEYFPDCIIETMPQRSDEWFAARKGILTASNFGPWLLATGKVAEGAKEKAICKLIAERANCDLGPNFENWAMKRGTELEPQAVAAFEGATGIKIQEVGFCKSLHGDFGCSPDGLVIGESAGLEGKVPVPDTHIRYRRAGELPSEYLYQVHGSDGGDGREIMVVSIVLSRSCSTPNRDRAGRVHRKAQGGACRVLAGV